MPRKILGDAVWRLASAPSSTAGVALVEPRAEGRFGGGYGLAMIAEARPSKSWVRRLKALLRRPASYFVPRCDRDGTCPQLRCRTTPRAVITLKEKDASAVVVVTVCHAVQAGPSMDKLGPQVSMEPVEGRLLALLRELFPKDTKLRQEQADWREARRGGRGR